MKKKILLLLLSFSVVFISMNAAETELLNTNFSTYEALSQTSGSTPVVSTNGNYQVVRGAISPVGTAVTWAAGATSYFLTSSSAGLITFNNLALNNGGRIEIKWGSTSGRPLNVTSGATTIGTHAALTTPERSTLISENFTIPASLTGNTSITIASSGGGGVYIFEVKVYTTPTGPQAPQVTTFSIDGAVGTIAADTVKVNLPFATYTEGVTSVNTSLIVATTDSTAVTTSIEKAGVAITSFIVGEQFQYIVSKGGLSDTLTVVTTADVPAPTLTNPANKSQSVKGGEAIADIEFTTTSATNVTLTGTLPSGVTGSYAAGVYTISGIAATETTYPQTYTYTVTATPIGGYTGAPVTQTGTITVKDPAAKTVAYLYTASTATTPLYNLLNSNYSVTVITASNTAGDTAAIMADLLSYDLVVLDEAVNSANLTAQRLGVYIGQMPILNTKSHMYGKTNWPAGGGNSGITGDTYIDVEASYKLHPIFAGITFDNDSVVTMANATGIIRGATAVSYGNGAMPIANAKSIGVAIIENNNKTTTDANKYMLIALAAANPDLSANGLALIKNACDYLMSSTVYVPADALLSSLTVSAGTLSPAFISTKKAYSVVLPFGSTDYPTITPTAIAGATVGTITSATFPGVVSIPVSDGVNSTTYTISFTVATGVDEAISSSKVYAVGSEIIVDAQVGAEVAIINLVGTVLYKGILTSSNETLPVSLEKGVYIVLVNGNSTKLLVK